MNWAKTWKRFAKERASELRLWEDGAFDCVVCAQAGTSNGICRACMVGTSPVRVAQKERDEARAAVSTLRAALEVCADNLEDEIRGHHGVADDSKLEEMHPVSVRRFNRDMNAVREARAALAATNPGETAPRPADACDRCFQGKDGKWYCEGGERLPPVGAAESIIARMQRRTPEPDDAEVMAEVLRARPTTPAREAEQAELVISHGLTGGPKSTWPVPAAEPVEREGPPKESTHRHDWRPHPVKPYWLICGLCGDSWSPSSLGGAA